MRILFVWTGVASYMSDCWRRLQQSDGIELRVIVEMADSGKAFSADKTLSDLDYVLVEKNSTDGRWKEILRGGWRPDVLFAGGWRSPTTRNVVAALSRVPKVFCLDMPWRWQPRCFVARFALHGFLRNFSAVFVPGRLSAMYARWLGFPKRRVFHRLYSVDQSRFCTTVSSNQSSRRGFLFAGRFSPEKRVDIVKAAYARYRQLGGEWDIDYYGQGGKFAQAEEMPAVYASHACLLLASSFDPWPLVMLEAKCAGLEVIASSRCGNCDELGAIKVPYGDVEAMAKAMVCVERGAMCSGGVSNIAEYDCTAWAKRVLDICREVCRSEFFCPGLDDVGNGMAVVARLLSEDDRFRDAYIVHGAWLPAVWLRCFKRLIHGRGYVRMPHGSYSPICLERSGKFKKRLVRPVERWLLRRAAKVVATCEAERDWILAYEPKARVEVVDVSDFYWGPVLGMELGPNDKAARSIDEGLRVLYMGRRHPLKGVDCLEEAVRAVNENGRAVTLRVVSDAHGIEKEKAFDWCDVLCLPTLSENFGIVVAEALARDKPVITTDGAPAWADDKRVTYIKGYRDAPRADRVRLLKSALMLFLTKPEAVDNVSSQIRRGIWYNSRP